MSQNLWNIDNSAYCLAQGFAYYRWSINLSNEWANKDDKQKSSGFTMPGVSFREQWARSLFDALSNQCKGAGGCSLIANNKTKHKQKPRLQTASPQPTPRGVWPHVLSGRSGELSSPVSLSNRNFSLSKQRRNSCVQESHWSVQECVNECLQMKEGRWI